MDNCKSFETWIDSKTKLTTSTNCGSNAEQAKELIESFECILKEIQGIDIHIYI